MDSIRANKSFSSMNNSATETIIKKVVRYDLNISEYVHYLDNCHDSTASEEYPLQICDMSNIRNVKVKQQNTRKKTKGNKENMVNKTLVQDTQKIQRTKSKQRPLTRRSVKPKIDFKTTASSYVSQKFNREMCEVQLEELAKQNLSNIPLTKDEINTLITKYKTDGHFYLKPGNHCSKGLIKGEATNGICCQDNIANNNIYNNVNSNYSQNSTQENNVEYNDKHMSLARTTDEGANDYERENTNLFNGSDNTSSENLSFTGCSPVPFEHTQHSQEENQSDAKNFVNNIQEKTNMPHVAPLESNGVDIDDLDNNYNNPSTHASWNNTLHVDNGIQQDRNPNEIYHVFNSPSNFHEFCPSADMISDGHVNDSYRNMNDNSVNSGFPYDIVNHSTNQSVEAILGQNLCNSSLAMPSWEISNPDFTNAHNTQSLTWNIEPVFNNSYAMYNEVKSLDIPVERSDMYACSLVHNKNFIYPMENINNNIGVNYDIIPTPWQDSNMVFLSNVGGTSEVTFSGVNNTS